ncbi:flagellar assembly protein FliH [Bacillus sp. EB600]|uniref:flagellar assembly protein FliH n=1 Tax=Bacillus sp. EB600 TaxID=2806345 RepID=UPI00210A3DCC|nr:flagellar assembly protein FliH [Bacillus sp. EB600]
MILLSKVIKSGWAQSIYDEKIISIKMLESLKNADSLPDMNLYAAEQEYLLKQASSKAEMIVKEAQSQVQSIREQISREKMAWEQEKASLAEAAREEGFSKGVADGKAQGYQEYHNAILFAQEVVNTAKKDYQHQVASAEKVILKIGISAAEKILGEKLNESEDGFLAIAKRALKEARESRDVQLHVHPCHYEFLLSRKDELTVIFPKETDIYIYPNDELAETSCLIESANGRIDASIDSQLKELKRKLLDLIESES